jgi:hypothetical protein
LGQGEMPSVRQGVLDSDGDEGQQDGYCVSGMRMADGKAEKQRDGVITCEAER